MTHNMNHTFVNALRAVLVAAMALTTGSTAMAQVKIHGNVYGGGNEGLVEGRTEVNIKP